MRGVGLGDQGIQFLVAAVFAARVFVGERSQQARRSGAAVRGHRRGWTRNASRPSSYQRASTCCALSSISGHVDRDVVFLADAVEPADALLEQIRIQRQVPQDQAMGELEVATFRADLRAQQQARAVRLGEERGVAVALHDAQAFVETRDADAATRAQRFLDGQYLGLAAADQQELVLRMLLQQVDQRGQARIVGVIRFERSGRLQAVGAEFGEQGLATFLVERVGVDQDQLGHAARETADAGATVAEHHPSGTVAVDQRAEQMTRASPDRRHRRATRATLHRRRNGSRGSHARACPACGPRSAHRRCAKAPRNRPIRPGKHPDRGSAADRAGAGARNDRRGRAVRAWRSAGSRLAWSRPVPRPAHSAG